MTSMVARLARAHCGCLHDALVSSCRGCSDIEHALRAALREAADVARVHRCQPGFRCPTACGPTIASAIEALAG